jgi:hypothetical protein
MPGNRYTIYKLNNEIFNHLRHAQKRFLKKFKVIINTHIYNNLYLSLSFSLL